MFNTKKDNISKKLEHLEKEVSRFYNDLRTCEGCGCLILDANAYLVEDLTGANGVNSLYFCHKCKPDYDTIDNDHIKWKLEQTKTTIINNEWSPRNGCWRRQIK